MKKLPVIALAMFFAVGSTLALAQGAGGGAGAAGGKAGAGGRGAGAGKTRAGKTGAGKTPAGKTGAGGAGGGDPAMDQQNAGSAEGGNVPVSSPIVAAPLTVAGCDCKLPVQWSCGGRRSSVRGVVVWASRHARLAPAGRSASPVRLASGTPRRSLVVRRGVVGFGGGWHPAPVDTTGHLHARVHRPPLLLRRWRPAPGSFHGPKGPRRIPLTSDS